MLWPLQATTTDQLDSALFLSVWSRRNEADGPAVTSHDAIQGTFRTKQRLRARVSQNSNLSSVGVSEALRKTAETAVKDFFAQSPWNCNGLRRLGPRGQNRDGRPDV